MRTKIWGVVLVLALVGCDEDPECLDVLEESTRLALEDLEPWECSTTLPLGTPAAMCSGLARAVYCFMDESFCDRDNPNPSIEPGDGYRRALEEQLQCLESRH